MKKLGFLTCLTFSILLGSCKVSTEERVTKGSEYFPIQVGSEKLYAIDTITYNPFNQSIDTVSNIFKEVVVEKYADINGDTMFRLELMVYDKIKADYVSFRSFERKINENYAIEKLENKQEVKMLFPIAQYKTKGSSFTWNTNMFNNSEPVVVKYFSVFSAFNNGNKTYNDCVSVRLNKPITGFVNNVKEEVYAKNVGLVYRFIDSTDSLNAFLSGKRITVKLIN